MKCRNCKKDFHYCSSCGYFPEAEMGCCSDLCVTQLLNKMSEKDRLKELVRPFYEEMCIATKTYKDFILDNKEEFGKLLVDYVLA